MVSLLAAACVVHVLLPVLAGAALAWEELWSSKSLSRCKSATRLRMAWTSLSLLSATASRSCCVADSTAFTCWYRRHSSSSFRLYSSPFFLDRASALAASVRRESISCSWADCREALLASPYAFAAATALVASLAARLEEAALAVASETRCARPPHRPFRASTSAVRLEMRANASVCCARRLWYSPCTSLWLA